MENNKQLDVMTVGGGCFWCIEAIFEHIEGVGDVISGYSGGKNENPTYEEVCGGRTGHAEVVQIHFDPNVISYEELLVIFFTSHDPTTVNGQGADVGSQYRSVVFYHNDTQKALAEEVVKQLNSRFDNGIVTEISPLATFYEAEAYHQDYYRNNSEKSYCRIAIDPKIARLRKMFADRVTA